MENKIKKAVDFYNAQFNDNHYADGKYHGNREGWISSLLSKSFSQPPQVLEIGCGRGQMQNVVHDFIGCDLSLSAGSYLKKPFVVCAAENLPFKNQSFDSVMSFTVLEHIINPELALAEMVRVLRRGGLLVVDAAWRVPPWRPLAMEIRPYKSLRITEKVMKFCLPVINRLWCDGSLRTPFRAFREMRFYLLKKFMPLPFTRISPNWDEFLLPDSDAAASIDNHACALWLFSQGLSSVNTVGALQRIFLRCGPLVMTKSG